ncbi:MAG: methyltransferase domain-containing protein [Gomphosphaeria aponina SAG 52.96 = DSM 107014]|uniref:Methyltransferase domain-containing protein n=1 Tax=Gomphosphaeria aponina SAG 52.96 = DSM 107014 TaxID=1521640 RepID=A0A941GQQ3_9CHRO|nr:methyltransferase domain-containing protein [Gomphosphaeria aponina SAG 52.96 = DSM 107014]
MQKVEQINNSERLLTKEDFGSAEEEKERFQQRVLAMQNKAEPIYIQFGCGPRPFSNFLNVDVKPLRLNPSHHQKMKISYEKMYKNIFYYPWLDSPLPIPDNCVDFVCHEDMFEHLSQMQQFLLLAEVKRILKPKHFHRINTPCLADSMRIHSEFSKGYEGVYQGEWKKWNHINLITRNILDEMARIVGYSYVAFNSKNGSVSGVEFTENRPARDRDRITGNVFADLMK